jgi:type IV pilus assembly protein PilA
MFKKFGSKLKEQKGFTLIELLAVIVILGIIAAIAIPAISNVINKSEKKAAAQEGLQIINAAKMFMANESDANKVTAGLNATTFLGDLDQTDLAAYLDRTDDPDFTVTVSESAASSGVFVYTLKGHDSTPSSAGLDEDALILLAK